MSRIAKKPIELPKGVEFSVNGREVSAKGPKGRLTVTLHDAVELTQQENLLTLAPKDDRQSSLAVTGTMRAVVNNIVEGVTNGFEKKMQLVGVGYRAQAQGRQLSLSLGLSHPVNYQVPEGIEVETPAATEIVVRGCDKQQVGQVCAEIRAYRPPEPYKGKGIKYADEQIVRKEAKKK
ncbi:MAG: 50S ribosomal protein L6 [Gammaproteobacteria bacterium]|nr:50S ribosomal protein L6 [Gammaproteobacteria bacterium]MDH3513317.1 50S ribosomal protein L6 [Gammaproteobacteria bacterium]